MKYLPSKVWNARPVDEWRRKYAPGKFISPGLNFSYGTLRQDKYVGTTIPLLERSNKLTWRHHYEVAPLPPDQQQYWLNYADRCGIP